MEEHGDGQFARFKCLTCYSVFTVHIGAAWRFCPTCGDGGGMTQREIPRKKYFDNAGVWKVGPDGAWTQVKAPVFTIVRQFKGDGEFGPLDWETSDSPFDRVTDRHDMLDRYFRPAVEGGFLSERWVLVPSQPLPLP